VDHLVYATAELERTVADLEKRLGVRAAPGGRHPGEGTRNALIALGSDCYLEILAPDSGGSEPKRPLWLGLEKPGPPRLAAWASRSRDLDGLFRRASAAGVRLGSVVSGSRKRSDGAELVWRFTDPHVVLADGLVPFFIDWGRSPHPASSAPDGVSLVALRAEHPNPAEVVAVLQTLGVQLPVTKGARPSLIAGLETSKGFLELR